MASFQSNYGPWALVTGASAGIGAEFARQLAAKGLNLVLVARRREPMERQAETLRVQHSVEVRVVAADLSKSDFMSTVGPATDGLEVGLLVNNVGFGVSGAYIDSDLERQLAMLDVNCRAPMILAHAYGRQMAGRGRGGIICVASVLAFMSAPLWATYVATKAHNLHFAEALRYELRPRGVDVLALCPGATRTEFQEVAHMQTNIPMMPVEPVVAVALRNLGKKSVAVAGWRNRLICGLIKIMPRRAITWIWAKIARRLLKDA